MEIKATTRIAQITWVDRDNMIREVETLRKYFDLDLYTAKCVYDMVLVQMNARNNTFGSVVVGINLPEHFDDSLVDYVIIH